MIAQPTRGLAVAGYFPPMQKRPVGRLFKLYVEVRENPIFGTFLPMGLHMGSLHLHIHPKNFQTLSTNPMQSPIARFPHGSMLGRLHLVAPLESLPPPLLSTLQAKQFDFFFGGRTGGKKGRPLGALGSPQTK